MKTFPLEGELAIDLERARAGAYLDGEREQRAAELMPGLVKIHGALMQRSGWFWDGHADIAARIEATLRDPDVSGVLLDIDSPGGAVAGLFEAIAKVRSAKDATGKPIVAYANELAASAAYAWASVADEIVAPQAGVVGSVGAIMSMYSLHGSFEKGGVKVAVVTSGKLKADGHPFRPMDDEAVARAQERVDTIASMLAKVVVAGRGDRIDEGTISKLEGATLLAEKAQTVGLIDHIGGFDLAKARLAELTGKERVSPAATANGHRPEGSNMKATLLALGLKETASEEEAVAEVAKLKADASAVLSMTGASSMSEALASIKANAMNAEQAARVADEMAKLKAEKASAERTKLVDDAIEGMKLKPAAREETLAFGEKHGTEALQALIGCLVPMANAEPVVTPGATTGGVNAQLAAELEKQGVTAEEFTKLEPQMRKDGWIK